MELTFRRLFPIYCARHVRPLAGIVPEYRFRSRTRLFDRMHLLQCSLTIICQALIREQKDSTAASRHRCCLICKKFSGSSACLVNGETIVVAYTARLLLRSAVISKARNFFDVTVLPPKVCIFCALQRLVLREQCFAPVLGLHSIAVGAIFVQDV